MHHPITTDPPLPWEQHELPGKPPLSDVSLHRRRERVFAIAAGLHLLASCVGIVYGLNPHIDLSAGLGLAGTPGLPVSLGLLALPLSFLCTDIVCELFGRRRANLLALTGIAVCGALVLVSGAAQSLDSGEGFGVSGPLVSILALYSVAQLVNVQLFHVLREWSNARRPWLRNTISTLCAQLAGCVAAPVALHLALGVELTVHSPALTAYPYAVVAAIADTVPFLLAVRWLSVHLRIQLRRDDLTPAATEMLGPRPVPRRAGTLA